MSADTIEYATLVYYILFAILALILLSVGIMVLT